MKMATKNEYLKIARTKYETTTNRKRKSQIIDEVRENTGLHRKSVIRALNRKEYKNRQKPKSGRKVKYKYELRKPLRKIWKTFGKPCSKNLQPQMQRYINKLKQFGEIDISERVEKLLVEMGTSTMDRLLKYDRDTLRGKGISGTRKSPLLKSLIPIRVEFGEDTVIGDLEIDCILHCGEHNAGAFAETLNALDIATHWNEKRIFLKKTKHKVIGAFHEMRKDFPFPIQSIDFDNGPEFVNWALHGYCKREGIGFTRSRSYHKNDQAHIEGKNYPSIRKVVGYKRIEDQKIVELIADIYKHEHRLLTNYFYATRKLTEKVKVGGKYKKKYGKALTPYQRVMKSRDIDKKIKIRLANEYLKSNPAELNRLLEEKLAKLTKLISVTKLNQATTFKTK